MTVPFAASIQHVQDSVTDVSLVFVHGVGSFNDPFHVGEVVSTICTSLLTCIAGFPLESVTS